MIYPTHNKDIIVKLKGVEDRDAAALLTNFEIAVDSTQLPDLDNDEYYWKDLMGCHVVTSEGYDLGTVIDMMETGSNDVLVIKANLKDAFGIKERLVPFLDGQVIKKVDLSTKIIEVEEKTLSQPRIPYAAPNLPNTIGFAGGSSLVCLLIVTTVTD